MAKPVLTLSQIISQLDSSYHWSSSSLSYGFASRPPIGGFPGYERGGLSLFTATQKQATNVAMSLWSDLIPIDLSLSTPSFSDILLVNYIMSDQAYAYFPNEGDIFINPQSSSNFQLDFGDYGFTTLVHEIGHALGLDHPGQYDAAYGLNLNYLNDAEYQQDSLQYTIMSYWEGSYTGADHHLQEPSTPLLHDIAAIQSIYGANTQTRKYATVYGFNSTTQQSVYDFNINSQPVISLWDAGGIDTIDLSGFNTVNVLDLHEGAFSDVGGLTKNLSIAFNSFIENAIGGSADDTLIGQRLNNRLEGGSGNDWLRGNLGDDLLFGGSGNDTALFSGLAADYNVVLLESNLYHINGLDGIDTLYDIEFLQFEEGERIPIGTLVETEVYFDDSDSYLSSNDASNTLQHAYRIEIPSLIEETVGNNGDNNDFFLLKPTQSGTMTVKLKELTSDIDLYLLDENGEILSSSIRSKTDDEEISYSVTDNTIYYLQVSPWLDDHSSYQLSINTEEDNPEKASAGVNFSIEKPDFDALQAILTLPLVSVDKNTWYENVSLKLDFSTNKVAILDAELSEIDGSSQITPDIPDYSTTDNILNLPFVSVDQQTWFGDVQLSLDLSAGTFSLLAANALSYIPLGNVVQLDANDANTWQAVGGQIETFVYEIDSHTYLIESREGDNINLDGFNLSEDQLIFLDVAEGTTSTASFTEDAVIESDVNNSNTKIIFDETLINNDDIVIGGEGFSLTLVGISDLYTINYMVV